jgi:hypothetical protein
MCRYSLIMPVYNAEGCLSQVLPNLSELGADWEIIVVDDGSDQSPDQLVWSFLPQARCVASERARGAAGARNHGAQLARGRYLCFLDSDVVVEAGTLQTMLKRLESSGLDGIFGCYAAACPGGHSPISRFRNLLHRAVHRRCAGPVASFWTGLGALRQEALFAVGGFDEGLSESASIEDVELGARLSRSGYRILLDPEFEGAHLKNWTWVSMIRTDIWLRAEPWTRLILSGRVDSQAMNGGWRFRVAPLLLLISLSLVSVSPSLAALTAAGYLGVNLSLCAEIAREGGPRVALVSIPAMTVHHLSCWVGASLGGWKSLRCGPQTVKLLQKPEPFGIQSRSS